MKKSTIQDLQYKVKNFCGYHNWDSPFEHRILDVISQLGELSKEVLKSSKYGKDKTKYKEEIKDELGDVFFSIITLANYFEIDLDQALSEVIDKYEDRIGDTPYD